MLHFDYKMLHLAIVSKYYTSVHPFPTHFDYYMFTLCFANGPFYFNNNVFCSMLLLVQRWKSTATKLNSSDVQEVKKTVNVNIGNNVLHLAIVLQTPEKTYYLYEWSSMYPGCWFHCHISLSLLLKTQRKVHLQMSTSTTTVSVPVLSSQTYKNEVVWVTTNTCRWIFTLPWTHERMNIYTGMAN